jgi:hypothetical protein
MRLASIQFVESESPVTADPTETDRLVSAEEAVKALEELRDPDVYMGELVRIDVAIEIIRSLPAVPQTNDEMKTKLAKSLNDVTMAFSDIIHGSDEGSYVCNRAREGNYELNVVLHPLISELWQSAVPQLEPRLTADAISKLDEARAELLDGIESLPFTALPQRMTKAVGLISDALATAPLPQPETREQ